jgi:hypothetical protein
MNEEILSIDDVFESDQPTDRQVLEGSHAITFNQLEEQIENEANKKEYYNNNDSFAEPEYTMESIYDRFNIGSQIEYGGEIRDVNTLSQKEHAEVLSQAMDEYIEHLYENVPQLEDDEIEAVDFLRNIKEEYGDVTLQDIIRAEAERMAQEYLLENLPEQESVNEVSELSDDQVMLLHLQQTLGDVTNDDLLYALNERKNLSSYPYEVQGLRNEYEQRLEQINAQEAYQNRIDFERELEEDRVRIVTEIDDIDSINGIKIPDNVKEHILSDLLEVHPDSSEGHSRFIHDTLSNPSAMFELLWAKRILPEVLEELQEMRSNQMQLIKEAEARGRQSVLKGGNNSSLTPTPRPKFQAQSSSVKKDMLSLDDLYSN